MVNLPIAVRDCLSRIRKNSEKYVEAKAIKGHYYAFEVTWSWDRDAKKEHKATRYLGRITNDGKFVPARHRNKKAAQAQIPKELLEQKEMKKNSFDITILKNLSMNARMSVPTLAKRVGLSITATRYQVKKLEKEYSIKYLLELDLSKIGYLPYLTFVKFIDEKMPDINELNKALSGEYMIQLVLMVKGDYNLVLYVLAKDNSDISNFSIRLQTTSIFKDYRMRWFTTPDFDAYNFIPLRDEFFELIKDKVWKRTRETPRPPPGSLTAREYAVLREMNSDGAIEFAEIDARHKLERGASQYAYKRMKDKGIIKRTTISESNLAVRYNAIILTEVVHGVEAERTRPEFLSNIIADTERPINKYLFASNIEVPHGGLLVLPVFSEGELEQNVSALGDRVKGVEVKTLIITNTLIGRFCYRLFDNDYSRQYELLVWHYKTAKPHEKTKYGEA